MFNRMSPSQSSLWNRLKAFTIGDPEASLGFAQRLARDSNWSLPFAQRVIEEYKKFLFLAMEAGHPVTPSDEVDQAWHLHLVYTESYWNELCRDILPRPLHHGPTKGGKREGDKFNDWYAKTLDSHERFFGQSPPKDIWPSAAVRFGRAPHFRRINAAENWIIPKRAPRAAAILAACGVVSLGLIGCGLGLAQSGNDGAVTVLVLVVTALVGIGILAALLKRALGGTGQNQTGGTGCGAGCGWLWWGGTDGGSHHGNSASSGHGYSGCSSHHGGSGCSSSDGSSGGSSGDGGGSGCGSSGCGGGGCGGGGCGGS